VVRPLLISHDMKTPALVLVTSIALTSLAFAGATVTQEAPRTLGVSEVNDVVKPLSADLERCYLDNAADVKGAGKLDVKLGIFRKGTIFSVDVATPGLPAKLAKKVEACVKKTVANAKLTFPARKADTTIVIPFLFQKTNAPNSGPYESCWDPRGCRV